jgi:spore coat polysaccharide biosynthesis predicted glycosyltransferase SpsG
VNAKQAEAIITAAAEEAWEACTLDAPPEAVTPAFRECFLAAFFVGAGWAFEMARHGWPEKVEGT